VYRDHIVPLYHAPARNEAVRAAEDGRTGPLPTLTEAIDEVFPKQEATVSGLRTEMVILEPLFSRRNAMAAEAVKWCDDAGVERRPVNIVTALFSLGLVALPSGADLPDVSDQDGDRVAIDWQGLAKVLKAERDAAIRERDELQKQVVAIKEQSHDRWRSMNNALCELSKVRSERDAARARVAELEAASGEREAAMARVAHLTDANRALQDAADAACDLLDESKARVAELERQVGQADAEDADTGYALRLFVDGRRVLSHELGPTQAGAFLIAADHLAKYIREEYRPITDATNGSVAELEAASGGGEKKPMRMPSREWFARMVDVDEANISVGGLASRVAEVEAASGGGEQEPVAWGISNPGHPLFGNCEVWTVRTTEEIAKAFYSAAQGWQHFPLYRSPPQPRGWLTGEERDLIAWIVDGDAYTEKAQSIAKGLLDRSSPPEVVLPENPYHPSGLREGFEHALRIVRNELVNAGVGVKDATK
jgi:hypothetical protein